jgi:hypothetical protein
MRTLVFTIFILSGLSLYSQEANTGNSRIRFQSDMQLGFLEGSAGPFFQIQSVNGIRYKTYSIGIGAGLDYYAMRSIPLFLDIKKDLFKNRQTPFFYLSGGRHFPWEEAPINDWTKSSPESGLFYDAGIGYAIPLKKQSILFSAGYSFKAFDEVVENEVVCITWPCPQFKESYSYKLRRLSIRAGIRF